jgi:hypothetical protein
MSGMGRAKFVALLSGRTEWPLEARAAGWESADDELAFRRILMTARQRDGDTFH